MIEWLKLQGFKIWAITATALAGFLGYLWLSNIQITMNTISNSQSISNSSSFAGALSIGYIGGDYRGKWDIQSKECLHSDALSNFLQTLDPIQFLNAKVVTKVENTNTYIVFYPIISDLKDSKTVDSGVLTDKKTKTINGLGK